MKIEPINCGILLVWRQVQVLTLTQSLYFVWFIIREKLRPLEGCSTALWGTLKFTFFFAQKFYFILFHFRPAEPVAQKPKFTSKFFF